MKLVNDKHLRSSVMQCVDHLFVEKIWPVIFSIRNAKALEDAAVEQPPIVGHLRKNHTHKASSSLLS